MIQTRTGSDRRVSRTKKSICNAYTKLLTEKNFRSITVTDIAKAAEVNRKTFYNYYECIDDIMKEIIDNILTKLFGNNLENLSWESFSRHPEMLLKRLNTLIEEDFPFYTILFKLEEPGNLLQKIEFLLRDKMVAHFLEQYPDKDPQKTRLLCEYCTAGMISSYRYWFNSGRVIPLEEFSKNVLLMTQSCVESLSKPSDFL